MIGIDTCSWLKLLDLAKMGWKDLFTEIFSMGRIFITREVKRELEHHVPDEKFLFEQVFIYPKRNISFKGYLDAGFDEADASLLEYSEDDRYTIITEDGDMLAENISGENNIVQLVDFFVYLTRLDILTNRELYHLTRYLRRIKNITKRKEKKILKDRLI